jgi:hypothetical protein
LAKENVKEIKNSALNDLLQSVNSNKEKFTATVDIPQVMDTMSQENCENVLEKYANKNNCTTEEAVIAITLLVQNGGTNLSKKSLSRTVNNKVFTLEDLRAIIKEVEKNGTVRKFAKGIRDIIINIAIINKWTGPLKNNLKINNPNVEITEELGYWCLEIHSDNINCPQLIKEALIRREEQLRLAQNQAGVQSKPRKLRGSKQKGKKTK